MSLYHKYRPQKVEDMQGNATMLTTLAACLKKTDKPHAFLFTGPSGCGKTTLGRIVADALGCTGSDYREIDSAQFRGIDTIREIRQQSLFKAIESSCRVYLLDEVHQIGSAAAPALLKALEDAPPHVFYILCTTDPQKLLPTIRGRCAQFEVKTLTEKEMYRLLRFVVKSENEKLDEEVYAQIIQDCLGQPRNALQILDQVLAVAPEQRLEVATKQAEAASTVLELCRALINASNGTTWKKIATILSNLKDEEPERVRRAVRGYCNSILLKGQTNNTAALILENMSKPFYSDMTDLTLACYTIIYDLHK
jgi:DNA polymerase III gamma/tau subunit